MCDNEKDSAAANRGDNVMGKPGTVASDKSLTEEKAPGFHPQNAHEAAQKVAEESEGQGVVGTAKKALAEVDRQVSGEYEHREEGSSARVGGTDNGADPGDTTKVPDTGVAGAQVAAEEERFDGLVNEPANPPRQQVLQPSDDEETVDE